MIDLASKLQSGFLRRVSVRLLGVTLLALMAPFLIGVMLMIRAERGRIEHDQRQRAAWIDRHYRQERDAAARLLEPERSTALRRTELVYDRDLYAVRVDAEIQAEQATRDIQLGAAFTLLGMAVFVVAAVRYAHRRILLDRLGNLVRVSQHVSGGDFSHRCSVGGRDELTVVAESVNTMLDTIARSHGELEARVAGRTDELRAAVESAERAAAAKGEFLAVVSHEIRTPMNAVLGASELLLESNLTDEQRELLQTVRKSGGMLLDLINDVLDYSKIEVGKIEIESTPFDLEVEVETVVRVFEEAARQRGIELRMELEPGLQRMVVGDPMRLRQVVMNLLSNAVKFTPSGSVVLRLGPDPSAPGMVRCAVKDSGIGIREKDLERLFAAFVQADVSTTRKYGGTGLGLAICKRLVEMMGGTITVRSEPGKGSEFAFTMRLPQVGEDQRAALANAACLRGRGVLVFGSDDDRTESAARVLEDYLALVLRARDAEELRCAISGAGKPDVVVVVPCGDEDAAAAVAMLASARIPALVLGGSRVVDNGKLALRRLPAQFRRGAMLGCLLELVGMASNAEAARADSAKAATPRRTPRVLVADDNEINQRVVEAMLKRLGCEVTIAGDGVDAVTQCASRDFDLVLMDYQMPGLDGPEAARRIREDEQQRGKQRVAIVALTANAGEDFEQRCTASGMDDFVTKPMQRADLKRVLDAYADGAQS